MFSRLFPFILVALLAVSVAAQSDDQYLGGSWGKKKLSPEESMAMESALKKVTDAAEKYGANSPQAKGAAKALRDLMSGISGQPKAKDEPKEMTLPISDGSGVPYEEIRGQKNAPQMVTDTVRCSDGFGVLDLNAQRGRGKLSVVPSSSDDIHVFGIIPIITDSTQDVPTYGAWINRELNQLNIQSSDTSDTRLVQVSFMVQ